MARKKSSPSEHDQRGLTVSTLATIFVHARTVTRLLPAHKLSTIDQLIDHFDRMTSRRKEMMELFRALEHLEQDSRILGATTLVRPADHPLVIRQTLPPPAKEEE